MTRTKQLTELIAEFRREHNYAVTDTPPSQENEMETATAIANANLIAAAPDLLAALIGLLAVHDRLVPGDPILNAVYGTEQAARIARAAIRKAANTM